MDRKLVCRDEAAGHPFRRMLPPAYMDDQAAVKKMRWWQNEDLHLFMLSFSAFFIAFSSFIA